MAKPKANVPAKLDNAELAELQISKESELSVSQVDFDSVFTKEVKRVSIDREYFSPEGLEGQTIRCFVTGMGQMKSNLTGTEKMLPTIEFKSDFSGEVKNYISSSAKLAGMAMSLKRFPAAIEITYKGKKKSGNSAFKFDDFQCDLIGYAN